MKYKLLVLDVDGTLLDSEKKISKRTLAALLKVQQMGVRIVLASGRPTYGLMPIAKALELGNYGGFILSYNGGQIINAQSGELLFERRRNPVRTGSPFLRITKIPSSPTRPKTSTYAAKPS